jgi:hypothetical protein
MIGNQHCSSDFHVFDALLGYPFKIATEKSGMRMHIVGVGYGKTRLAPLYGKYEIMENTKNLCPLYDILFHMFRENIPPSVGNSHALRGGLVNLMYHAHRVYLAGPNMHGREIDVMDLILHEMYHTILERKKPIYSPYVMKLIHAKNTLAPITVLA